MIVGASCTAELIQDDPGGLAESARPADPGHRAGAAVLSAEGELRRGRDLPTSSCRAPRRQPVEPAPRDVDAATCSARPRSASATATTWPRSRALLDEMGIEVNVVAPLGASPADLARLGAADFNVLLYPETGESGRALAARRRFGQPFTRTIPIGVGATRDFIAEVARAGRVDRRRLDDSRLRQPWWARLGRLDLPDRQARLHLRRRHPRDRRRPHRARRDRLRGRRPRLLQPRIRPRRCARLRQGYGVEALITDDYLDVEARDRRRCSPN